MEPIFEPLTKETFRQRIRDSFPGTYLTTISIIQGVALGILASKTFGYIKNTQVNDIWVIFLPYSIISFGMLVVVSFEYVWFLGVCRWPPKVWDTLCPFTLGFSEVGPMFYLTEPKNWWLCTGIICFIGAGVFFNTLCHCKDAVFGQNNNAFKKTKNVLRWNISIALVATLICIVSWMFSPCKVLYWYLEIPFLLALFAGIVFMIWKSEKFMKDLHSEFELTR